MEASMASSGKSGMYTPVSAPVSDPSGRSSKWGFWAAMNRRYTNSLERSGSLLLYFFTSLLFYFFNSKREPLPAPHSPCPYCPSCSSSLLSSSLSPPLLLLAPSSPPLPMLPLLPCLFCSSAFPLPASLLPILCQALSLSLSSVHSSFGSPAKPIRTLSSNICSLYSRSGVQNPLAVDLR